jgi:hypothetical protein
MTPVARLVAANVIVVLTAVAASAWVWWRHLMSRRRPFRLEGRLLSAVVIVVATLAGVAMSLLLAEIVMPAAELVLAP